MLYYSYMPKYHVKDLTFTQDLFKKGPSIRGVQRHHYLYQFNQQTYFYLYLYSDKRPEVGVIYARSVFSNLIFIGNGIWVNEDGCW